MQPSSRQSDSGERCENRMQSYGLQREGRGKQRSADTLGSHSRHVTSDRCACPQRNLSESSDHYGTLKSPGEVMGGGHSTTVTKMGSAVHLVKWVQW